MSEELFPYYAREWQLFKELAKEFADRYPRAAGRLQLHGGDSRDPHVERLIQAVSLLAARVHHKLDDEFPELSESLLGVLYPHLLAPVPSMAIVQFALRPGQAQAGKGQVIERGGRLRTQSVGDLELEFRTGYPVALWPVTVTDARFRLPPFPAGFQPPADTAAAVCLQLQCHDDLAFSSLPTLKTLRFYLAGDDVLIADLYELLFNSTQRIVIHPLGQVSRKPPVVLSPRECLAQVGFGLDEGLLPYPRQSFLGYRLLTEFFAFPNKFLFFDLGGWQRVSQAGFGNRVEVTIFLRQSSPTVAQGGVNAETFRLGCTPAINLFDKTAEAISLEHTRYEYPVKPDVTQPLGMEVYSVESITGIERGAGEVIDYKPFYSYRHGGDRHNQKAFWTMSRRSSTRKEDPGTDVYVNLVDLNFDPTLPEEETLVVRTLCTNRDLPNQFGSMGMTPEFTLLGGAVPVSIKCVKPPTPPLRRPLRRGRYWRLVSHLCLSHLSFAPQAGELDGMSMKEQMDYFGDGRETLREILRLYDISDCPGAHERADATRQLIEGIQSVAYRRVVGRAGGPVSGGFCKGMEVTIQFDEEKYIGTGVFLFASVLERFLGLYANINSFARLVGKTKRGVFKTWGDRAGELQLL